MSLCTTCQSIDLLNTPKLPPTCNGYPAKNISPNLVRIIRRSRDSANSRIENESLGQPFHQSLKALQEAAIECAICKVVAQDVSSFQVEFAAMENDEVRGTAGPDWNLWVAKGENDVSGFMVVSEDGGNGTYVWILSAVGFCVDDHSPLSGVVAGRKIEEDPTSETTLRRALSWIQTGDAEKTAAETTLPPRVLDVSSTTASGVALHTSHEQKSKYAALSHPSETTVVESSAIHGDAIDQSALSKVFQDAIIMTRKLGLQYLWIDSLCTVQVESAEPFRTTPEFASVYLNAYITISATGASSDSDGLLASRSPPTYNPFPYTHDKFTGKIFAFSLPKEPTLYPNNGRIMENEPLSQHGWALQDRLFAPRILHFGSQQMYFESNVHFLGEDGFKMIGRHDILTSDRSMGWRIILGLYRKRSLPKPSDKLPALSNIARHLAEQSSDTYVAGLWRSKLVEGLIWQATGHFRGLTSEAPEYRAPSWSWASIDGPFGMFTLGSGPDAGEYEDMVEIVECEVKLKTSDPYGEVTDAWIKMRAPLEALYPAEEAPRRQIWKMKTKNGDEGGMVCIFDTSARVERAKTTSLYAIPLTKGCRGETCQGSSRPYYHGIVVAAVEGKEGTFERMGKVVLDEEVLGECEWMQDKEKLSDVLLV